MKLLVTKNKVSTLYNMIFLFRTFRYALVDFWRNFWLSFITVSVVFIAIFSINSLILIKTVSDYTLQTVEKKIDVSVFINPDVEETSIYDLRSRLLGLSEVKEVIYISADEALQSMKNRHAGDDAILQSIEELGVNPLGAQLIVQANSTDDYGPIVSLLGEERYDPIIAEKNFDEHTYIIERVSAISKRIRSAATFVSLIFGLVALIVVFNTLRVIIYTHREEIAIMRLVGATKAFIRMPYIWQSAIYSILSLGLFLLIWYPILGVIQLYVNELFSDGANIDLFAYYNQNFVVLFGSQLIGVALLLALASFVATSKYSRV